ncbi:MAG: apolipoprotein N-acyltransferase [Bacillota bacterium]
MVVILTALTAALLTAANYFPNLYILAWIGFLPFLYYIYIMRADELNYKLIFFNGWHLGFWILAFTANFLYHSIKLYTGASFFLIIIILILLFSFLALIYAFFFLAYFYLQQNLFTNKRFSPFLFALCWTVMEISRYYLLSFFPLANLSYTQTEFLSFIQLAEIGGIWILSFILVFINSLLFQLIFQKKLKNIVTIVILFLAIFSFANFKVQPEQKNINNVNGDRNIEIGIITTEIDQNQKWTLEQLNQNIELTLGAVSDLKKAELIIAPETNITFDFYANRIYRKEFLKKIAAAAESSIQIGSLAGRDSVSGRYNSSFLISESGKIISRYDKNHLLYFGETYPFLELLNRFTPYNFSSLNAGKEEVVFRTKNLKWKTVICSEILYPSYVNPAAEEVDFIVNQTNEGWFNNSRLLKNIMWQAAVIRAVENRVPVIKTGNYSYNGIIYSSGKYKKITSDKNYHLLKLN